VKRFNILGLITGDKFIKGFLIVFFSSVIAFLIASCILVAASHAATLPPPEYGTYIEGTEEYDACMANDGFEDTVKDDDGNKTNVCIYNYCVDKTTVFKLKDCSAEGVLDLMTDIFTIIVGAGAIIGFIVTGILYATSGGSEEHIKIAKKRTTNIIIGLVVYALAYTIVAFLIPNS